MEIIIILLVLAVLAFVFMYNKLVRMRNRVQEAWADIDVQLKRRHDLIPNLVDTVKGYMTHEREVLENVTKARAAVMSADNREDLEKGENMLSDALKSLFAVSENYPDLKASQNFMELQRELSDTENKIQAARRFYNSNVREYNTATEQVPTNIVAGMFGFQREDLFKIEVEEERDVPDVEF
ncbi:MAG: LemA family protein [Candidatus Spechtbacterales bacterium]|nr:LemA family protein [Candidatus Spechtbacterales bacterium]